MNLRKPRRRDERTTIVKVFLKSSKIENDLDISLGVNMSRIEGWIMSTLQDQKIRSHWSKIVKQKSIKLWKNDLKKVSYNFVQLHVDRHFI